MKILLILFLILLTSSIFAQDKNVQQEDMQNWNDHFQFTAIFQGHSKFSAKYSGQNSLDTNYEDALSVTSTLFIGRKLWKGASVYVNGEIAAGKGVSGATGIAGFTNGETFRIGNPAPQFVIARAFYKQHFAIGKKKYIILNDDLNQLREKVPESRITLTLGKFSLSDIFDDNKYSHDPRTQFINWGIMANGAWDYPADTRGYTVGFVAEYIKPDWALRVSSTLEPTYANGPVLDWNVSKSHGETIEFEKDFKLFKKESKLKLMYYENFSRARIYREVIDNFISGRDSSLIVNSSSEYRGKKFGLGLNFQQEINDYAGFFLRLGWNDGKSATWAYTEIDQSFNIGFSMTGKKWKREDDGIGIAVLINGISKDHRDFLNIGGYGFIIGDGKLTNYGLENIIEAYYCAKLTSSFWMTVNYQFVQNPGYNMDRGPVHVFAARGHVQF
jgi:high affinity Mn2+ porin